MEPWGTPVLVGCSREDLPSRITRSRPELIRKDEISPNTRPELPYKTWVGEEEQHIKPCRSLGYIKSYSSSNPSSITSPSSCARLNCHKIFNWSRRPETILETFLPNEEVTEILCSFRLVLEGEEGKDIPESSRCVLRQVFSK